MSPLFYEKNLFSFLFKSFHLLLILGERGTETQLVIRPFSGRAISLLSVSDLNPSRFRARLGPLHYDPSRASAQLLILRCSLH